MVSVLVPDSRLALLIIKSGELIDPWLDCIIAINFAKKQKDLNHCKGPTKRSTVYFFDFILAC